MPLVQIKCWPGRSEQEKAEAIQKVTEAVSEGLGVEAEYVTVVIQEYPKENWGAGGVQATQWDE
jgi:4-oxalocrotonate tautomerase